MLSIIKKVIIKNLRFLLLAVLAFTTSMLRTQDTRFVPGYYLTTDQDTIRGYIEDRYQIQPAGPFKFKPTLEASFLRLIFIIDL